MASYMLFPWTAMYLPIADLLFPYIFLMVLFPLQSCLKCPFLACHQCVCSSVGTDRKLYAFTHCTNTHFIVAGRSHLSAAYWPVESPGTPPAKDWVMIVILLPDVLQLFGYMKIYSASPWRTTNTYFTEGAHVLVIFGLSCTLLICIFNLKKKGKKTGKGKRNIGT